TATTSPSYAHRTPPRTPKNTGIFPRCCPVTYWQFGLEHLAMLPRGHRFLLGASGRCVVSTRCCRSAPPGSRPQSARPHCFTPEEEKRRLGPTKLPESLRSCDRRPCRDSSLRTGASNHAL